MWGRNGRPVFMRGLVAREENSESEDSDEGFVSTQNVEEVRAIIKSLSDAHHKATVGDNPDYKELIALQRSLTLKQFAKVVKLAGPDCPQFLDTLVVEVKAESVAALKDRRLQPANHRLMMGRGPLSLKNLTGSVKDKAFRRRVREFWEKLAKSRASRNPCTFFFAGQHIEFTFRWTGVKALIELLGPWENDAKEDYVTNFRRKKNLIVVLRVLADTDPARGVWRSMIGRAVILRGWQIAGPSWVKQEFLSAMQLVALAFIQKTDGFYPNLAVFFVAAASWWQLVVSIIEGLVNLTEFGSVWPLMTFRNTGSFLSHVYSLALMLMISAFTVAQQAHAMHVESVEQSMNSSNSTFGLNGTNTTDSTVPSATQTLVQFLELPSFALPFLMTCRWFIFADNLLLHRRFGKTVLPAVLAVFSRDSVYFALFSFVGVFACTVVYLGVPVQLRSETLGLHLWKGIPEAFLRMLKLTVFGEVDFQELAGRVDVYDFDSGEIDAAIEDPAWGAIYSNAGFYNFLRVGCSAAAVFGAIINMNVYIGVLSNAYTYIKANADHYHRAQQARAAQHFLLRRLFWHRFPFFDFEGLMRRRFQLSDHPSFSAGSQEWTWPHGATFEPGDSFENGMWLVGRRLPRSDNQRLLWRISKLEQALSQATERVNEKFHFERFGAASA